MRPIINSIYIYNHVKSDFIYLKYCTVKVISDKIDRPVSL